MYGFIEQDDATDKRFDPGSGEQHFTIKSAAFRRGFQRDAFEAFRESSTIRPRSADIKEPLIMPGLASSDREPDAREIFRHRGSG